jgi:hypothetical protein
MHEIYMSAFSFIVYSKHIKTDVYLLIISDVFQLGESLSEQSAVRT